MRVHVLVSARMTSTGWRAADGGHEIKSDAENAVPLLCLLSHCGSRKVTKIPTMLLQENASSLALAC